MVHKIKILVDEDSVGIRVDKLLMNRYEAGFPLMQKLIRSKDIKINSKAISKPVKLELGDEIEVFANLKIRKTDEKPRDLVPDRKIEEFLSLIIYEDDYLIAINKPSGLAVQGKSLNRASIDDILHNLRKKGKRFYLVHRLDRDTSGVLLLAKSKQSAEFLSNCFKRKDIEKTYLALLCGNLTKKSGVINIPLKKKTVGKMEKVYPDFTDGKEAISNYKLIKNYDDCCLVEFKPITGRTHQLRVHAKEIGHPIVGDFKYGGKKAMIREIADRLCLHAQKIEIQEYFGKNLTVEVEEVDFI